MADATKVTLHVSHAARNSQHGRAPDLARGDETEGPVCARCEDTRSAPAPGIYGQMPTRGATPQIFLKS